MTDEELELLKEEFQEFAERVVANMSDKDKKKYLELCKKLNKI